MLVARGLGVPLLVVYGAGMRSRRVSSQMGASLLQGVYAPEVALDGAEKWVYDDDYDGCRAAVAAPEAFHCSVLLVGMSAIVPWLMKSLMVGEM